MSRIASCARWLVVLLASFVILTAWLLPGVDDALTPQATSRALIYAYAVAFAFLLYQWLGRGSKAVPAPGATPEHPN